MENNIGISLIEKQEITKLIEELPLQGQIEVLQLVHGYRLVAEIIAIPAMKEKVEPVVRALKDKGYSFVSRTYGKNVTEFFVSADPALAEEVKGFVEGEVILQDQDARFGELMGFPPGSIESFVKHASEDFLSDDEIEKEIGFNNYFFNSKLSRSHLEESIEYLKKQYRMVYECAPRIIMEGLPREENADEYMEKMRKFIYS